MLALRKDQRTCCGRKNNQFTFRQRTCVSGKLIDKENEMKKVFLPVFALTIIAAVLLAGCSTIGYYVGVGSTVTKEYDYKDYTDLEISYAFQFEISQSSSYSLTVSTHENLLDHLDIYQSGKTLIIRLKPGSYSNADAKATVALPELERLVVSGASRGTVSGFKSTHDLNLKVSGASRLNMNIEAGATNIDVTGASNISGNLKALDTRLMVSGASHCELSGSAGFTSIEASGASRVDSDGFQLRDASIKLSGASRATINTNGNLNIDATGASTLNYLGNPILNKVNVSGASKINNK